MNENSFSDINWTAVFVGFSIDWAFSLLVGMLASALMLALKGIPFESNEWPTEVLLVGQIIGVGGAIAGGLAAGFIARHRGNVHGLLASLAGLLVGLCLFGVGMNIGDVGFIILNLIGASYGGGMGERFRVRHEQGS